MNLLVTFILLNIINVIIQTVKSIATIKCGKVGAALANAVAYGLYTIVIIYMVCDLNLWLKVLIVGCCNLIGVFVVKWIEEIKRKTKLWKVEATVPASHGKQLKEEAEFLNLSFNYIDIGKYWVFNFYCPTQKDSTNVKGLLDLHEAKYFVSESKTL